MYARAVCLDECWHAVCVVVCDLIIEHRNITVDKIVLVFSTESLSKGFAIIIDNRHGNLTSSVKKLLSAAEV